jgi:hypothetical protein
MYSNIISTPSFTTACNQESRIAGPALASARCALGDVNDRILKPGVLAGARAAAGAVGTVRAAAGGTRVGSRSRALRSSLGQAMRA